MLAPTSPPPFHPGQRGWCRLRTLNDTRYAHTALHDRAGTVVAVGWYAPSGRPARGRGDWPTTT